MNEDDFPALYAAADQSSLSAQNKFLVATKIRLFGLIVAATAGVFSLAAGDVDVFGVVGLLAFLGAVAAEIFLLASKPERIWYEGRAAAESAKTLTWRFVTGGAPLPKALTAEDADDVFLRRLREVLQDLKDIDLTPSNQADRQITPEMRRLRALPLEDRRHFYDEHRIEDQRGWYAKKSKWNTDQAKRWALIAIALELIGVVAAAGKAFRGWEFDALGPIAALGVGATAWVQAKQYQTLGRAYFVASQELATIRVQLERPMPEDEWGQFVQEAEEAISREHTLWRASRGVQLHTI